MYQNKGERADIGALEIMRIFPDSKKKSIGPIVFLDHLLPTFVEKPLPRGAGAHPHRGIATFTYLLEGAIEHYDSNGNHGLVNSGGIQWMKAGLGVIHEENFPAKYVNGIHEHALQFWINLPAKHKVDSPKYIPVQKEEVPEIELPEEAGLLRVLIGTYQDVVSPVDTYTRQFIFHIILKPGKKFFLPTVEDFEYAAFLPSQEATINQEEVSSGSIVVFDKEGVNISFESHSSELTDIILFGGEPYLETIVADGPFVMNSMEEIYDANRDFREGKYGYIDYKTT